MLRTGLILAILLCLPEPGRSQHPLEIVKRLGIESRDGEIPLYFSTCCEKRALDQRSILEDAIHYYDEKLSGRPKLNLAVLNEDDWKTVMSQSGRQNPYGIPFVTLSPHIAFVPADDGGNVTKLQLSKKPRATPTMLQLLATANVTFDDAARRVVTFVALHELGHVQAILQGFPVSSSHRWFSEFSASYFAYTYLKERHPTLALIVEVLAVVPPTDTPKHTSLHDFATLYSKVGPENYMWYQSQFNRRVVRVYVEHGAAFLAKIKMEFSNGANENITPDQLLARLERISPGFEAWARETFESTPSLGGWRLDRITAQQAGDQIYHSVLRTRRPQPQRH